MNPVRNYLIKTNNDKDFTKDDEKLYDFFLELEKIREREKNRKFQKWLNTEIDYNNYYYDEDTDEYSEGDEEKIIKIKNIITYFTQNLMETLKNNGYEINNEKQFKDEIASTLYRDSC